LDREALLEQRVVAVVEAALDQAHARRRQLGEPRRELTGGAESCRRVLARLVDEADLGGSGRVEPLPEQEHPRRARAADEARQPLGAPAARDDPEPDLRA